jgi:hypothetical protein
MTSPAQADPKKDETPVMPRIFANPTEIAQAGQKIYEDKYRADYEKKYPNQFVAIDVNSGQAFVASGPEEAVAAAKKASPNAIMHLIRIGSSGAFKVSYRTNEKRDWIFR